MSFQTPITIAEAIGEIQASRYVLPAIQREFVWSVEQIERVFDSLMRGYPIGSFLFWQIDPQHLDTFQFYRFMDHYHQRDHRHNEPIDLTGNHNTITAVLDGQQRLTALNIGLKGWYAYKLPWYRWSSEYAFPKQRLYLNLGDPPDDMEFAYEFRMLRDGDARNSGGKFWFPVGEVLGFKELAEVYDYCFDRGLTTGSKFPHRTLMRLWEVLNKDLTINYYLEKQQDLDKVLNIFIRVNSGGTQLSYSDMLLSIATAQWQEKDAREEIYNLVDSLNTMGEGFSFSKDFVLKASSLSRIIFPVRMSDCHHVVSHER